MEKYKYSQHWFLISEIRQNLPNILDQTKENRILEIGCFEGLSAVYFADNFLDHPKSTLTCVDPYLTITDNDHESLITDEVESNFDHNISICNNANKITVHKVTSNDFFNTNTKTYNMIYIDGSHECHQIMQDMENAFKILENNGIMWMDDYGGGDGIQIKNTMNRFLEKYDGQYILIHSGYQLAIQKYEVKS